MNRKDLLDLKKINPELANLIEAVWDYRQDHRCGAAREPIINAAVRLVPQEEFDGK